MASEVKALFKLTGPDLDRDELLVGRQGLRVGRLADNNLALNETGIKDPLPLSLSEADGTWPLIRYLMDDPVYHEIYVDEIRDVIADVFYPDRMQAVYETAHELIRPYVVGDEGENDGYTLLYAPGFFDSGLDYLENHVAKRHAEASRFVEDN